MGFFGTFRNHTAAHSPLAPLNAGCGTYLTSSGPQAPRAKLPATRKKPISQGRERGDISDIFLRASSKLPGTVVCVLPILQERDGLLAPENALIRRAGESGRRSAARGPTQAQAWRCMKGGYAARSMARSIFIHGDVQQLRGRARGALLRRRGHGRRPRVFRRGSAEPRSGCALR